ncbi:MAG: SRPBCC family protein [Chthoniobacterales bacterium]
MQTGNSILIRASKEKIFEAAADLSQWPRILPHYRYIDYIESAKDRHVVKMACYRTGIPISWMSEEVIDREKLQVRFHHLKAFTKGMNVVWTFTDTPDGVLVEIMHYLRFRIRWLAPIAGLIIGNFFISYVAGQTLKHMKLHLENPAT